MRDPSFYCTSGSSICFMRKVYTPSAHVVPFSSSTRARMTWMVFPIRTASAQQVSLPLFAAARNRTSQLTVRQKLPREQAAVPAA